MKLAGGWPLADANYYSHNRLPEQPTMTERWAVVRTHSTVVSAVRRP